MSIHKKSFAAVALSLAMLMPQHAHAVGAVWSFQFAADNNGSSVITQLAGNVRNQVSDTAARNAAATACSRAISEARSRVSSDASLSNFRVTGNCRSETPFRNQCVAFVVGASSSQSPNIRTFYNYASSATAAQNSAFSACQSSAWSSDCRRIQFGSEACDTRSTSISPPFIPRIPTFTPTRIKSSSTDYTWVIVGGVVGALFLGAVIDNAAVSYRPIAEYGNEGGIRRWRVGVRSDWQSDNWSAHWQAAKVQNTGDTDGFSIGSGVEWKGDIFAAAFNNRANKEESDYDFSLKAKKNFGVWTFSPSYRTDYHRTATDETWGHALSANLVWRADKWTLTNSAGFFGDSLSTFGDNASAKIQLRRDF